MRLLSEINSRKQLILLIGLSSLLLLFMLGMQELWTQEIRWAEICKTMLATHDYLHPYLYGYPYYDKPLMSYWFMIASTFLLGQLSEWSLRLPSALAGITAIGCIYYIGKKLVNQRVGIIAGWMLITTYYFIFWARTANSDMLNVAGILLSIAWYFGHKNKPTFINYVIFFVIMSVASLCKGLLAAVIPLLVILPDLMQNNQWKNHLRPTVFFAVIPAILIYYLPFWASAHIGGQHYNESGLTEVFRENILRFTHPFDHKGPIYLYFYMLPLYLSPWTLFFIPAVFSIKKEWHTLTSGQRWIAWAILLVFIFFTASGSRRNYYTLTMVPFAILFTASWIERCSVQKPWLAVLTKYYAIAFYLLLFSLFCIIKPYHYSSGGLRDFASQLRSQASAIQPWQNWTIALLNPKDQAPFYVNATKQINYPVPNRKVYYPEPQLLQYWSVIKSHPANTIFLTSAKYVPEITPYLSQYTMVITPDYPDAKWWNGHDKDDAVAFIPKHAG